MSEKVCAHCGGVFVDRHGFDLCNDCMNDAVEEMKDTQDKALRE